MRELRRHADQALAANKPHYDDGDFFQSGQGTTYNPPPAPTLPSFSGCKVKLSGADPLIPNTPATTLTWATDTAAGWDTDNYFSAGTPTVLTVPAADRYEIHLWLAWFRDAATNFMAYARPLVNGVDELLSTVYVPTLAGDGAAVPITQVSHEVSRTQRLSAGDQITIAVLPEIAATLRAVVTKLSVKRLQD